MGTSTIALFIQDTGSLTRQPSDDRAGEVLEVRQPERASNTLHLAQLVLEERLAGFAGYRTSTRL